jgi:3-dehydroquinate dehydratase-2
LAKQRHNILILNGPNLNMLGVREPDLYGFKNLSAIALECEEYASELGFSIDFRQSNHEGELVTIIQEARGACSGLIINGGAYSHTSVALLDALKILDIPIIEVHLSNIFKRESFRHHSHIATVAQGTICGFGGHGYILALDALRALLDDAA